MPAQRTIPALLTPRLVLTLPVAEAAERVVAYYEKNAAHHGPWDPPLPKGWLSLGYWRPRLQANRDEYLADQSMRLFLANRHDPDGPILGTANFTGFTRGPFQCCRLGYSLDVDAVGKGLMTEGLRAALEHVFDFLRFHRVEANYVPTNTRSGNVLRRLGFSIQGYARDYLFIDGQWRDHVLTALTTPTAQPPPVY